MTSEVYRRRGKYSVKNNDWLSEKLSTNQQVLPYKILTIGTGITEPINTREGKQKMFLDITDRKTKHFDKENEK